MNSTDPLTSAPAEPDEREGFTRRDSFALLLIALLSLSLYLPGLGTLEFFRNTEADRTLIAWEMVERGDYLVPHLLGSVILTKPPLFYWLLSGSMRVFGDVTEWIVRVPSVLIAVLFLLTQFFVVRRAGFNRTAALAMTTMLGTSAIFLQLATVAEIDMLFGFLTFAGLQFFYLANRERCLAFHCLAYGFAALAFLTKGPPIVFFWAGTIGLYALLLIVSRRMRAGVFQACCVKHFLICHILGALTFLVIVALWLNFLLQEVAWSDLVHQFRIEVLDRAFEAPRKPRGVFFYFSSVLLGLLPWTLLLVPFSFVMARRESRTALRTQVRISPHLDFFVHQAVVFFAAFLMLSIAEGKASRYLFPVLPFACNLLFLPLLLIRRTDAERNFLIGVGAVAALAALASLIAPWVITINGVSLTAMVAVGVLLCSAFALLAVCIRLKRGSWIFASVFACVFAFHQAEVHCFFPYRNAARSVKPIAFELARTLPKEYPLYTIECFERWVVFYLKKLGWRTSRITKEEVHRLLAATDPDRVHLLLHEEEEGWRLDQLRLLDPSLNVLRRFDSVYDDLLLVEIARETVKYIHPHEVFPTFPSLPYYFEKTGG